LTFGLPLLPILAILAACDFTSDQEPSPPTGLSATGALGVIHLSWKSGGPVVGHNIYRSIDNVTFVKRNGSTVSGTSYNDAIPSPTGDGVFYYYRITAVDSSSESGPSGTVRAIHGTRLAAAYPSGFTTDNVASPYVLEGKTVVDNGSFVIRGGDQLYLMDNAVLDVERGNDVTVHGLLRVLAASGASHATITSHRAGGLAPGEGFSITFDGADDFNPADDSGTWLRNTLLSNLKSSQAIVVRGCSPRIENCKAVSNDNTGASYLSIEAVSGPIIRDCSFDSLTLRVSGGDFSSTMFGMAHNLFTNSFYAVSFRDMEGPGVKPGQIANNVFDGRRSAYLNNVTGASVPLGNNFWSGAFPDPVPAIQKVGTTTSTYSFDPVLTEAPLSAGPDW
jgi:hypothetical protein